jgi:large subunit ribosomal protein L22
MEAIASAKYLRGSAQKARLVVDMIRGKRVGEALAILQFTNKRAADPVEKCLRSAIANATEKAERQNVAVDPDDLFVKTCFVDIGPTKNRRRVRPAPQGRAYREQRHFCHVTVTVSTGEAQADAKGKGKNAKAVAEASPKSAGARRGAKKAAGGGDAQKTTTKRAPAKAEAAPAEGTQE